ncbi:helix-hairpin-helix domain-containing protein [Pseudalkalibacillus caeni]|uniref:Pathogenicity locus n=1 Tax=Exobacillus caeni TaxID=2574798 RepID=A0A5R9F471_9BACL|nr:helix-hairpin-helix domain-containing protein [Pseudalkalibacillus caeni]TLS37180.1 Pathogenicity locus [Pseudalkalibacillus caeni]
MKRKKSPKLPLTDEERNKLRNAKIKLADIHLLEIDDLAKIPGFSNARARYLIGLASFQQVPSIGYEFADKVVRYLEFYSMEELIDQNWAELVHRLERKLGCWTDPCVEDQVICLIHHASHPESDKQWFHFTDERKRYRTEFGYPDTRPKLAWYEKK